MNTTQAPAPTMSTTTAPAPAPSTAVTWVCQETFHADNTTSCIRYPKLKRCVTEGLASNMTFLCVDHDSISVGGSGPVPLPAGIVPFQCTAAACTQEAPAKDPSTKGQGQGQGQKSAGSRSQGSVRWTGVMMLAMVVAPMMLAM
ncbi:hypothetical protein BG003_008295 [Podila horticola]|nr:hypothetical protein BG003_008295 [Podila horticola]